MKERAKLENKSEKPHQDEKGESDAGAPGLTRREWILRLGEAVVLAGFSGSAPELLGAPFASAQPNLLPPGLYDASPEHMAHVLFRDQRFIAPPAGSETEYATPRADGSKPLFFPPEDFKLARRVVELMLNSTRNAAAAPGLAPVDSQTLDEIAEWIDLVLSQAAGTSEAAKNLTAQHRELAAHYYGEEAVRRLETADPQKTWREGLAWLDQESRKRSGQGFSSVAEAEQLELLDSISDSASNSGHQHGAQRTDTPGTRLYRLLKIETVRGYYSSRSGLKELDYKGNAFYPESPGCPGK
jgi:Gluconate 2-dehydrogenase subunit 3